MAKKIPKFSYTGKCSTGSDDTYWYIFLTTSGTLTFEYAKAGVDVGCVGGGGSSACIRQAGNPAGGSGGGGTVQSVNRVLPDNAGNVQLTPKNVGAVDEDEELTILEIIDMWNNA